MHNLLFLLRDFQQFIFHSLFYVSVSVSPQNINLCVSHEFRLINPGFICNPKSSVALV